MDIIQILTLVVIVVVAVLLIINMLKPTPESKEIKNFDNQMSNLRQEVTNSISNSSTQIVSNLSNTLSLNNESVNKQLETVTSNNDKVIKELKDSLEKLISNVNMQLTDIRSTTEKKLLDMQSSMDEKLDKSLNDRLQKSLQGVQEKLDAVTKGLYDMQSLASDVGDLKNVLTNVKNRGTFGENQLSNILADMLSSDQYDVNVKTKGPQDPVEFAVKLPGESKKDPIYLPIDSKFPLESYYALQDAYETSDKDNITSCVKTLKKAITEQAKKIHDKYINVPKTTEFGIMFLPSESLYAEVIKSGVSEEVQRNLKILITGPTTLSALLNSLQMGFRTLAIQEKTSEAWKVLEAVKTEFDTFNDVLTVAQNRINQANDELDKLIGVRSRQISSKLKSVQKIDIGEAKSIIGIEEGTNEK